ncbi:MAG: ATP synthase subunit C [Promethearchaeota archaeon]|nr:MAG: ATP synthase subunit C [Candidatus Lokiarchaeota archaeon]
MNGKQKFYLLLALFQIVLALTVFFSIEGLTNLVAAQTETFSVPDTTPDMDSTSVAWLALSASISVGAGVLAAGWSIKTTGTAAISALSEREGVFFKAFLVVALCEALAIYGLIVAILIWTKIP